MLRDLADDYSMFDLFETDALLNRDFHFKLMTTPRDSLLADGPYFIVTIPRQEVIDSKLTAMEFAAEACVKYKVEEECRKRWGDFPVLENVTVGLAMRVIWIRSVLTKKEVQFGLRAILTAIWINQIGRGNRMNVIKGLPDFLTDDKKMTFQVMKLLKESTNFFTISRVFQYYNTFMECVQHTEENSNLVDFFDAYNSAADDETRQKAIDDTIFAKIFEQFASV